MHWLMALGHLVDVHESRQILGKILYFFVVKTVICSNEVQNLVYESKKFVVHINSSVQRKNIVDS